MTEDDAHFAVAALNYPASAPAGTPGPAVDGFGVDIGKRARESTLYATTADERARESEAAAEAAAATAARSR